MHELPTLSKQTIGCFCHHVCEKTEHCHGNIIIDVYKDNITKLDSESLDLLPLFTL